MYEARWRLCASCDVNRPFIPSSSSRGASVSCQDPLWADRKRSRFGSTPDSEHYTGQGITPPAVSEPSYVVSDPSARPLGVTRETGKGQGGSGGTCRLLRGPRLHARRPLSPEGLDRRGLGSCRGATVRPGVRKDEAARTLEQSAVAASSRCAHGERRPIVARGEEPAAPRRRPSSPVSLLCPRVLSSRMCPDGPFGPR